MQALLDEEVANILIGTEFNDDVTYVNDDEPLPAPRDRPFLMNINRYGTSGRHHSGQSLFARRKSL